MSGFPPAVVAAAFERAQGRCERCGLRLRYADRGYGWSAQHRMARGMGGRSKAAAAIISGVEWCAILHGHGVSGCHGLVENQERGAGYDDGWCLRMGETPGDRPIRHWLHGLVYLTPAGGYDTEPWAA